MIKRLFVSIKIALPLMLLALSPAEEIARVWAAGEEVDLDLYMEEEDTEAAEDDYAAEDEAADTEEVQGAYDYDYTGEIDIFSGAPIDSESADSFGATNAIIKLPDGGAYDRRNHNFVYSVSEQSGAIHSSVANDIITTEAVSIAVDEGMEIILYKNSKAQTDADLTNISAPGRYTLVAKEPDTDHQLLAFRIVQKNTGELDRYPVPSGFVITDIVFDDAKREVTDQREVELTDEGSYVITYRCMATEVEYTIALDIDHTEPVFTLKGVEDGVARCPVELLDVAEDETVTVKLDGSELDLPGDNTFREFGRYTVKVTDPAGNSKSESFTIRMYLNYQGIIFFALAIGIIVAAVTFMYVSRERLRVR